ncbi:MAG TPA: class E sortase [Terrimesophilobacter sp.]|nr:class E sortase [Terrimesophilobacter sp.]
MTEVPSESAPTASAAPPVTLTRRQLRKKRRRTNIVGVLGELLITAGVLVFLFLGWQLWLNDIIVGEQHRGQAADLSEEWVAERAPDWDSGNIPTREEPLVPVDYGVPIIPAKVDNAKEFAIMYVPRFGSDYQRTIFEGIDEKLVLDTKGIGRYPDTQQVGEVGNFAVAAHRTTHGKPFADIGELRVGDKIIIRTPDAYYTYAFRNMEYVWPDAVDVLNPLPREPDTVELTDRIITLTSCNPRFSRAERIIAYGVLESWQPTDAGPPAEIAHLVTPAIPEG